MDIINRYQSITVMERIMSNIINHESMEKDLSKIIVNKGFKYNHSRKLVLQYFIANRDHMTPEEVYNEIKDGVISMSTVYRNIEIFDKLGIIKQININGIRYFELNMYSKKKLHVHFHCKKCGKINEYESNEIFNQLIAQKEYIEALSGDVVEDVSIVMKGVCSSCLSK